MNQPTTTATTTPGAAIAAHGGSTFQPESIFDSDRYKELDRKEAYYACSQHDHKRFDFDGRVLDAPNGATGIQMTQPLISADKFAQYVPLRSRRPSSPYRLPRVIVKAFTRLLFGDGRFPTFKVDGDSATQDYMGALARAQRLSTKMIEARDIGGACGTSVLSWCYRKGKPRLDVHKAKNLYVHEWDDRQQCIPAHVTECYVVERNEWVPERNRVERRQYYHRRDWTPDCDIVFKEVLKERGKQPAWEPDVKRSAEHNDGLCHVVWIQNTPDNEEIDGLPDYEGLYEAFDTLDLLLSVVARGATLNLDPTLKLKMDPDLVDRVGVKKGTDNALIVGTDGDADYLELGGQSIEAGIKLFNTKRASVLEVAQCVLPDPNELAAQGMSSVAMKMVYAAMTGQCDILREQYGQGMLRLLEDQMTVARNASKTTITMYTSDGEPKVVRQAVILPPRVETAPNLDDDGNQKTDANGKNLPDLVTKVDRDPGEGGDQDLVWPAYFPPTAADQNQTVTTLSTATGGAAFITPQTATEIAMAMFGRDPADEVQKMKDYSAAQDAKQSDMFQSGAAGGQVGAPGELPPGAEPKSSSSSSSSSDEDASEFGKDDEAGAKV